jgi:phage terminase Nu1 subunit (DNA packaging protein)
VSTIDLTSVLSQEAFGELVGISQPAVSDLMKRGVIVEAQTCGVWLLAYTAHLREQAAGRGADGELANERARLAREQADAQAMKNALSRKHVAPVAVLEEVLAHVGRQIATVLEGIQPKLKRRHPELTPEQLQGIALELARARQLAATVNLSALDAERAQLEED